MANNGIDKILEAFKYDKAGYDKDGYNKHGYDREGYDRDGWNKEGWNRRGISIETGTEYNKEGYNKAGYDKDGYNKAGYDQKGYNRKGWNIQGINKETGTGYNKEGYDRAGYDKKGYNKDGLDQDGYNRDGYKLVYNWLTQKNEYRDREGYNKEGYDKYGYNKDGWDKDGYNKEGYDKEGYDKEGWSKEGINKETGTEYNKEGYNEAGYDKEGYNKYGYDQEGYDQEGYDQEGYDKEGWSKEGINKKTGTKYDIYGRDQEGYDENGFQKRNGSNLNRKYNRDGYDKYGYNKAGYDREGYDIDGWSKEGINKETGTKYSKEGYDKEGYDKDGYGRDGYNVYGINRNGINRYTAKKDEDIELIEEWIAARTSRKMFASTHNIDLKDFERIIDTAIKKQPILEEQVAKQGKRASDVFLFKNKTFAKEIVDGKLTIEEFSKNRSARCNYDMMVRMLDSEERIILDEKIIEYISSRKPEITDYLNMFCEGVYNSESLKKAEEIIQMFNKKCVNIPQFRKYIKGVKQAQKDISTYKKPFKRLEVQRLGYYDEEKKENVMTEVTDELIETAKTYINNNQGYVCHRTMQQTLMKLIKGEITTEQVQEEYNRIHQNSEKEQQLEKEIVSDNETKIQMDDGKENNVAIQSDDAKKLDEDSLDRKQDKFEEKEEGRINFDKETTLQNLINELRIAYNNLNERQQKAKKLKEYLLAQLEVIRSEKLITKEKIDKLNDIIQENKEFFQELGELGNFEEKINREQEELEKKKQEEKEVEEKLASIDKEEKEVEKEKENIKKQIHDAYLDL